MSADKLNPWTAIKNETLRFKDLRGRTARRDYLWFILFWNLILVAGMTLIFRFASDDTRWKLGAALLVSLSIFAVPASIRRLHDVGAEGALLFYFLAPATAVILVFWLYENAYIQAIHATFLSGIAVGFVGFVVVGVLKVLIFILAIPLATIAATVMTLVYGANAISQLILPSEPGPNRYGPNPNEVPS